MGLPISKWDYDYCGIPAWDCQPRSRFSVLLGIGLEPVEIRSSNFLINFKILWTPDIRLFALRVSHQVPVYI